MRDKQILRETKRTKLKRLPKRGFYDFETIAKILDETFICQIGFSIKNLPFVIPTCFGRNEDKIYFHGAKNSRMLKTISDGLDICFSVTILDGIILARSAFHHSVNYRSVILFGKAKKIKNKEEKLEALKIITEHIIPGRWEDVRKPNEKELNSTFVLCLEISEGSAKIRSGPPVDDEEDMELPVWAGTLPVKLIYDEPVPDAKVKGNILVPKYLKNKRRD